MREGPCDLSVHSACFGSSCGTWVHWHTGSAFIWSELCGMAVGNLTSESGVALGHTTAQCGGTIPGASKLWQERAGAALAVDIWAGGQTRPLQSTSGILSVTARNRRDVC